MCKALQRSQPDKLVNWQHSVAGGGGGGGGKPGNLANRQLSWQLPGTLSAKLKNHRK